MAAPTLVPSSERVRAAPPAIFCTLISCRAVTSTSPVNVLTIASSAIPADELATITLTPAAPATAVLSLSSSLSVETPPAMAVTLKSLLWSVVLPASTNTDPAVVVPSPSVAVASNNPTLIATAAPTAVSASPAKAMPVVWVSASASLMALTLRSPSASMVKPSAMKAVTSGFTTVTPIAAAARTVPPSVSLLACCPVPPCPPGSLVWLLASAFPASTCVPALGESTEVPALELA